MPEENDPQETPVAPPTENEIALLALLVEQDQGLETGQGVGVVVGAFATNAPNLDELLAQLALLRIRIEILKVLFGGGN